MKIRKLKIENNEKVRIELIFNLDKLTITLFDNGNPTTFKENILLTEDEENILNQIATIVQSLYDNYKKAKKLEKKYFNIFEDKLYIEIVGDENMDDEILIA